MTLLSTLPPTLRRHGVVFSPLPIFFLRVRTDRDLDDLLIECKSL